MGLLHRAERVSAVVGTTSPPDDHLVVVTTPDFTWHRLLEAAAYGLLAVLAFASLVVKRGLDPVDALLAVLVVTALVLLRHPNGYGVAGVAGAALLYAGSTAYRGGLLALAHPASTAEFWHAATAFALLATAGTAAIGAMRRRPPSRLPTLIGVGTLAVTVLAATLGIGSSLAYDDPRRLPGDLEVRVERAEWVPKALEVAAGEVAVYVGNRDAARHTFTIRSLGVSVDVPGNHAARVHFSAPPGTYRFECTVAGHEHVGIRGTLFVH